MEPEKSTVKFTVSVPSALWQGASSLYPGLGSSVLMQRGLRCLIDVKSPRSKFGAASQAERGGAYRSALADLREQAENKYRLAYHAATAQAASLGWAAIDSLARMEWHFENWLRPLSETHGREGGAYIELVESLCLSDDKDGLALDSAAVQGATDALRDLWNDVMGNNAANRAAHEVSESTDDLAEFAELMPDARSFLSDAALLRAVVLATAKDEVIEPGWDPAQYRFGDYLVKAENAVIREAAIGSVPNDPRELEELRTIVQFMLDCGYVSEQGAARVHGAITAYFAALASAVANAHGRAAPQG